MDVSRAVSEGIKIWLCLGGVGLLAAWKWLPAHWARRVLLLLVIVGGLNYARWGPRLALEQVDTYDLVHYYLNASYFDELGYYDLYPAAILADHENGGPFFDEGRRYMAQDEEGHFFAPISHALDRGRQVRETHFTPERWDAFEHDLLVLQREIPGMNDKLWRQMIQDHGFNGTPVWTLIAKPIAWLVPVEGVKFLG
ncbi:MAG: hypothetical protein QGG40_16665, partial [Myxococcota bacterium]|nr:hypothetical protein [Myxococcota bacterium]